MSTTTPVQLGYRYTDKVTGFTGIATERATHINGCVQFHLAPPIHDDNKLGEGEWLDFQRLELVDNGVGAFTPVDSPLLGHRVKDNVTGFTGVVVVISDGMDGSQRIGVKPRVGKDGKMPDAHYVDACRIIDLEEKVELPSREGGADTMPDTPPAR